MLFAMDDEEDDIFDTYLSQSRAPFNSTYVMTPPVIAGAAATARQRLRAACLCLCSAARHGQIGANTTTYGYPDATITAVDGETDPARQSSCHLQFRDTPHRDDQESKPKRDGQEMELFASKHSARPGRRFRPLGAEVDGNDHGQKHSRITNDDVQVHAGEILLCIGVTFRCSKLPRTTASVAARAWPFALYLRCSKPPTSRLASARSKVSASPGRGRA